MKEIKLLSEKIEDEIDDAKEYIELALEYKHTDPELAGLFYKLSEEEMAHMNLLHKSVVRIIDTYKRTHENTPPSMAVVYEFLHKRFIANAEKVATLQGMYKTL